MSAGEVSQRSMRRTSQNQAAASGSENQRHYSLASTAWRSRNGGLTQPLVDGAQMSANDSVTPPPHESLQRTATFERNNSAVGLFEAQRVSTSGEPVTPQATSRVWRPARAVACGGSGCVIAVAAQPTSSRQIG